MLRDARVDFVGRKSKHDLANCLSDAYRQGRFWIQVERLASPSLSRDSYTPLQHAVPGSDMPSQPAVLDRPACTEQADASLAPTLCASAAAQQAQFDVYNAATLVEPVHGGMHALMGDPPAIAPVRPFGFTSSQPQQAAGLFELYCGTPPDAPLTGPLRTGDSAAAAADADAAPVAAAAAAAQPPLPSPATTLQLSHCLVARLAPVLQLPMWGSPDVPPRVPRPTFACAAAPAPRPTLPSAETVPPAGDRAGLVYVSDDSGVSFVF